MFHSIQIKRQNWKVVLRVCQSIFPSRTPPLLPVGVLTSVEFFLFSFFSGCEWHWNISGSLVFTCGPTCFLATKMLHFIIRSSPPIKAASPAHLKVRGREGRKKGGREAEWMGGWEGARLVGKVDWFKEKRTTRSGGSSATKVVLEGQLWLINWEVNGCLMFVVKIYHFFNH